MKRSEFWKSCFETLGGGSHGTTGANYLAYKADSAGTPWDPEAPPRPKLPKRLEGCSDGSVGYQNDDGEFRAVWGVTNANPEDETIPVSLEAVRRYNLVEAVREEVDGHLSLGWTQGCGNFCSRLKALIDGKEGS